ncbi:MAG TPA: YdeI/OmpD-associated family protein [Actinopolymorphaceae bacterium]|nr:YdeI/OmpD-associated family protein [Actinopolymorphaceae bacterium]
MAHVDRDIPVLSFASAAGWETWLAEQHATADGLWLKIAKKASGIETVSYAEALDIALCYGWIDGLRRPCDESYFLQRFSPRTARSKWSKVNRGKVVELIERGSMEPAGLRAVEAAKADGRWEAAYGGPAEATVPDDLHDALARDPAAAEFFEGLTSRNRYAILYRINDAKRPETRARRIEQFVAMLAKGEKPYP